jgi:allantoinase
LQVDEFPAVSSGDIRKVFEELADEPTTCMFHAEMIPPISASVGDDVQHSMPPLAPSGPLESYQTFLDSRPPSFETYAIEEIVSLASLAPKLPLHIVHLSAVEAIPILRDARAAGIKITAETCFHYLSLASEQVQDGDTRHKCCPPIRKQSNQDGLWTELLRKDDSIIKTIVSDHSPCTPDLKMLPASFAGSVSHCEVEGTTGDFFSAWGGISSVGLGLSILWTEGESRGITIEEVVKWCCKSTAKQVGLEGRKGDLAVGYDADIAVFDDVAEFVVSSNLCHLRNLARKTSTANMTIQVEPSTMLFRNKCSPYEGKTMRGVVRETWLRGWKIHSRETGFDVKSGPMGALLLEPRKV